MIMGVRFEKTHRINSVNPSFNDMWEGKKNFEVLFDPDIKKKYAIGDTLIFFEQDYMMKPTGRTLQFRIDYIFTPDYLLLGFIVVSLTKV